MIMAGYYHFMFSYLFVIPLDMRWLGEGKVSCSFCHWGGQLILANSWVEFAVFAAGKGVVGWCEGAVYLTSLGRPTDIGLQLGKACYPCSG